VWLGIWWAVETVPTVGYGDIVPQQTAGKLIAGFLMLWGLSLIAVVTAAITGGVVSRAQTSAVADDPVLDKLEELSGELRAVKAELQHLRSPTNPDSSD
jgi:voltage-gated potassium channel